VEAKTGPGGQDVQGARTRNDGVPDAGEPRQLERSQRVCQRHTLKEGG